MNRKYMAIETTDTETWNEIMSVIKKKLGSGVNAWLSATSWKYLIEELQEDYGNAENKK